MSSHFIPVRVHAREQREDFERLGKRFSAQWTPTTLIIDPNGVERHRIEGFLPADDFLAQLMLGLGHSAFGREQWADAEKAFRDVVAQFPRDAAAPEALYWAGVSRYKATHDPAALRETGEAFKRQYQDSPFAKKASVWAP